MKKIFLLLGMITAVCAAHASTCETRVDKHPKATTLERVDYCLTPEATPVVEETLPTVIYYGVSEQAPAKDNQENTSSRKQKYFDEEEVAVKQQYVGSDQFPVFKNDIPSEQERQTWQVVSEVKKQETADHPARVMKTKKSVVKVEKKAVKQSRKAKEKPARYTQQTTSQTISMTSSIETSILNSPTATGANTSQSGTTGAVQTNK